MEGAVKRLSKAKPAAATPRPAVETDEDAESGLRFQITDPNHDNATNILTENLTGSNPWKQISADFTTSPDTHFLAIRLRRTGSRLFENRLSGTVWVADVYLIPAEYDTEMPPQ